MEKELKCNYCGIKDKTQRWMRLDIEGKRTCESCGWKEREDGEDEEDEDSF